jgi:hypothetical protein
MGVDWNCCCICFGAFRCDHLKYCNCDRSFCEDCDYIYTNDSPCKNDDDDDDNGHTLCGFCDENSDRNIENIKNLKRIDLLKQIKKLCDESEFTDEQQIIMNENEELKNKIKDLNIIIEEQNDKYKVLETKTKLFKEKIRDLFN